jgi:hypothetical protein
MDDDERRVLIVETLTTPRNVAAVGALIDRIHAAGRDDADCGGCVNPRHGFTVHLFTPGSVAQWEPIAPGVRVGRNAAGSAVTLDVEGWAVA